MATLQNTTIAQNGIYRVGTSTDVTYISSGGPYSHLGTNAYYSSSTGWVGGGPFIQLYNQTFFFYANSTTFPNPFNSSPTSTTISSSITNINGTLGIGAANSNAQIRIQGSGATQPFLEVANCDGEGSTSTSTYATFGGFLGIHISSVGSITAGTYYIKLWS
jgi:hypothetical protein